MKYIRTTDGRVYEVIAEEDTKLCIGVTFEKNIYIDKKDVLKQGNVIEALCDRFVVDFENGEEPIPFKNYLDTLNYFGKAKIYGAIWTAKGLIYIAEIDKKGNWDYYE